MADKTEKKAVEFSECPKCRKHGYYHSKEFYACRYCEPFWNWITSSWLCVKPPEPKTTAFLARTLTV